MTRRTQRVGNLLRNTLAEILMTKISDPRIDPARVSITHVDVTPDLLSAKVHVSVQGTEGQQRSALRGLQNAAGRFQELLGRQIRLRHTPSLQFLLDESFKKQLRTLELIQQAMAEAGPSEDDTDADGADEPTDTPQ